MNAPEGDSRFAAPTADQEAQMSTPEFIGLVAMMMALTALAIDIMLPALPAIGDALGVTNANDRQVVIISYMLGFSVGQLGYGGACRTAMAASRCSWPGSPSSSSDRSWRRCRPTSPS